VGATVGPVARILCSGNLSQREKEKILRRAKGKNNFSGEGISEEGHLKGGEKCP